MAYPEALAHSQKIQGRDERTITMPEIQKSQPPRSIRMSRNIFSGWWILQNSWRDRWVRWNQWERKFIEDRDHWFRSIGSPGYCFLEKQKANVRRAMGKDFQMKDRLTIWVIYRSPCSDFQGQIIARRVAARTNQSSDILKGYSSCRD